MSVRLCYVLGKLDIFGDAASHCTRGDKIRQVGRYTMNVSYFTSRKRYDLHSTHISDVYNALLEAELHL